MLTDRAQAQGVEGYVLTNYYITGLGGDACNVSFIEGASYGWDQFDIAYYDMPFPGQVRVKTIGFIEGREAISIIDPPLQPGESASETFYGSLIVQRGTVNLEAANHYLTWSISGLDNCNITINGTDARSTNRLDLGTLTGSYPTGEHSTASWSISVEYPQTTPPPPPPPGPDPPSPPTAAPAVETLSAVDVGETNATLRGRIVGGEDECEYYFLYWAEGQTATTSLTGCCAAPGETFSVAVANLQPQTQYFYQAHARNDAGSAAGATQTFTTGPHSPQEPPEKPAPGRLRIQNVHEKLLTTTFELVYKAGATESPNDPGDKEYTRWIGIPPPFIVSKVGDKYVTTDERGPSSRTPVYINQMFHSDTGSGRIAGGDTNAFVFSFPEDKGPNERFPGRTITFQEYIPDPNSPKTPDPNAETYHTYLIRDMIEEDPNGLGVVLLPDLPNRIYAGTLHSFILRTDIPTRALAIADFNGDGQVDLADYELLLEAMGHEGNSRYDIARLKDPEAEAGSDDYGAILIGHGGDGIVDEIDEQAFLDLMDQDTQRRTEPSP
ncbi:hypothetical protein [Anaerobaca lacustris]|uniref:Fibronectin type-III domain-containing protein n=1 Tax=Anaerobaca lacustris TaxID=3044600 RepID=A0AAW6TQZ4_9BACT|nr:hypothetical protein [Sedimentisphaerales bacterium M17dextr]